MAFLMSAVNVTAPTGAWEWFILDVFGFIANYGWRIVLFVVLLKLILSPLDFYQKYKMRKNQRITEKVKPQLEKFEKQCNGDKNAVQKKQMELFKKEGYSYFSACLPLIITLVLFISFYSALQSVSRFMEFKQYVDMYDSYMTAYEDSGFNYKAKINPTAYVKLSRFCGAAEDGDEVNYEEIDKWLNTVFSGSEEEATQKLNAYMGRAEISAIYNESNKRIVDIDKKLMQYKSDYVDKGLSYSDFVEDYGGEYTVGYFTTYETDGGGKRTEIKDEQKEKEFYFVMSMSVLMQARAQEFTVEAFEENRTSFIWIKSLWVADVPWVNSLEDWSAFNNKFGGDYLKSGNGGNKGKVFVDENGKTDETMFADLGNAGTFEIVTARIREKPEVYKTNGYLILVILVIGLSLTSQFISTRQQKKAGQIAQGSGLGMMKVMMWVMPIMLTVFALTTSSAFTLYMVTNSAVSLILNFVTTAIVNLTDGNRKNKDVIIKHGRIDPNDKINK